MLPGHSNVSLLQLLNKSSELEAAKFAPDAYQDNLDELIKKAQVRIFPNIDFCERKTLSNCFKIG